MGKLSYMLFFVKNLHSFNVCRKLFDVRTAVRLPILFSRKVKIICPRKGAIVLPSNYYTGCVRLGVNSGSNGIWKYDKCEGILDLTDGIITFGLNVDISKGFTLKVINNAEINIGNNFSANNNLTMLSKKHIVIGNNVLLGWNITFDDGDGHLLTDVNNGEVVNPNKDIVVSDHVWIGAECGILKGSYIGENCVIGYGSIITKKFNCTNSVIAGSPAKVVKFGINWK